MTDIPNPDVTSAPPQPRTRRRGRWVWLSCGVVTVGLLTGLTLRAVDRVREAAAYAH